MTDGLSVPAFAPAMASSPPPAPPPPRLSPAPLQHFDRVAGLVREGKTRRELPARAGIVRLTLEHAKVKRDRFLHLLRRGKVIGRVS